jgi:hypothetical protein
MTMRRRGTRHDVVLQRRTRCELAKRVRPRAACRNTAGTMSCKPARTRRGAAEASRNVLGTAVAKRRNPSPAPVHAYRTDVGVGAQLVLPVGVAAPLAEHAHAHIVVAA